MVNIWQNESRRCVHHRHMDQRLGASWVTTGQAVGERPEAVGLRGRDLNSAIPEQLGPISDPAITVNVERQECVVTASLGPGPEANTSTSKGIHDAILGARKTNPISCHVDDDRTSRAASAAHTHRVRPRDARGACAGIVGRMGRFIAAGEVRRPSSSSSGTP